MAGYFSEILWGIAVMPSRSVWGMPTARRWPPAAGRWCSKWMGVACRLSPFTKMDGTACWGIGDSEGKRGAIVLFNCDTFLKILQRSWKIQEDPGQFMNQILQSTKIPQKKTSPWWEFDLRQFPWCYYSPFRCLCRFSWGMHCRLGRGMQTCCMAMCKTVHSGTLT